MPAEWPLRTHLAPETTCQPLGFAGPFAFSTGTPELAIELRKYPSLHTPFAEPANRDLYLLATDFALQILNPLSLPNVTMEAIADCSQ
jgi:hypothetical protein